MAAVDPAVLAAARAGDEAAFVRLVAPHRRALHVHAYRMLGSLHDADDALQETMLRAWRGLDRFEPRAPLAAWLFRIATNVCLRLAEQRGRRVESEIDRRLEPYPDRLLDELPSPEPGPDAAIEAREAIGLAFVAATQLLAPRQRAVLVLRDVLGWPAADVAELLGDSVPAVNSALQRARERLERERARGALARVHAPASASAEAELLARFQAAWNAADAEAIVELLAPTVLLTMPPEPAMLDTAEGIGRFFATVPMGGRTDLMPARAARANGQPALGVYRPDEADGVVRGYGLMVFSVEGHVISGIAGWRERPDLFAALGLPVELPPG